MIFPTFKVIDRDKSAIRIIVPDALEEDVVVEFCSQCGECIAVCPTQALYRAKNGIVRLRKQDRPADRNLGDLQSKMS
jgi:anaerobic carbon-monoxide dehydrogenase iron sulfur subunit